MGQAVGWGWEREAGREGGREGQPWTAHRPCAHHRQVRWEEREEGGKGEAGMQEGGRKGGGWHSACCCHSGLCHETTPAP